MAICGGSIVQSIRDLECSSPKYTRLTMRLEEYGANPGRSMGPGSNICFLDSRAVAGSVAFFAQARIAGLQLSMFCQ